MRLLFITTLILTLSGCSWFGTKPIEISTVPVEKVPLIVPSVDQYQNRDVEWTVITEDNVKEVLQKFVKRGNVSLFALTSKGYENISLNMNDILKILKQQQEIIKAFEDYYANELSDPTPAVKDEIPDIE